MGKMKAIIQNMSGQKREEFTGKFEEGKFKYRRGIIGAEGELPCAYGSLITIGRFDYAIYQFDGKNYYQLPVGSVTESQLRISIADYIQAFKIAKLLEVNTISKPDMFTDLLVKALPILAIVTVVLMYFVFQSAVGNIQAIFHPINQTLALVQSQQASDHNVTLQLIHIYNKLNFSLQKVTP